MSRTRNLSHDESDKMGHEDQIDDSLLRKPNYCSILMKNKHNDIANPVIILTLECGLLVHQKFLHLKYKCEILKIFSHG
jgi:hypothetical protein